MKQRHRMSNMKVVLNFIAFLVLAFSGCGSGGSGNCTPNARTICKDGVTYWVDSCGNQGDKAGDCECGCNSDFSSCKTPCNCTPDCAGRECGPDGCGGTCAPGCASGNTCNDSTGQCGNCGTGHDGMPTIIGDDADMDTFWMAQLEVRELDQLSGPDPGHTSLVQALFNDFTDYRVQIAGRQFFSDACFVYTSRQATTGAPIPLNVTRVTVGGLAGGDLVLEPAGDPPKINPKLIDGRAFLGGMVTFTVESGDVATDFPAFSEELPAPDPVVITRLGDRDQPDMSQGPSINISVDRVDPLEVRWVPGGGDYLEFKIVPGSGSDTKYAKLRCITYDDGCLLVPADALVSLAPDKATNFQLKAERHNFVLHSIKEGGVTVAVALIDVSSTLEATVLR